MNDYDGMHVKTEKLHFITYAANALDSSLEKIFNRLDALENFRNDYLRSNTLRPLECFCPHCNEKISIGKE